MTDTREALDWADDALSRVNYALARANDIDALRALSDAVHAILRAIARDKIARASGGEGPGDYEAQRIRDIIPGGPPRVGPGFAPGRIWTNRGWMDPPDVTPSPAQAPETGEEAFRAKLAETIGALMVANARIAELERERDGAVFDYHQSDERASRLRTAVESARDDIAKALQMWPPRPEEDSLVIKAHRVLAAALVQEGPTPAPAPDKALIEALEKIANPSTIAGMHQHDQGGRLQEIARAALAAARKGGSP